MLRRTVGRSLLGGRLDAGPCAALRLASRPRSLQPRAPTRPRRGLATRPPAASPNREADPPPRAPRSLYDYFPKSLPLGPPPAGRFPVDAAALRREFLALQAAHHPDKQPPAERAAAEAVSSAINHAYRTLADPLLRAHYLLSLRGREPGEPEAGAVDDVDDPDLLAAVLGAHEAVEEASGAEELARLKADNTHRLDRSEALLERAFADDDLEAARRELVRLRYWVSIRNSLDRCEEQAAASS